MGRKRKRVRFMRGPFTWMEEGGGASLYDKSSGAEEVHGKFTITWFGHRIKTADESAYGIAASGSSHPYRKRSADFADYTD
jgi:hypothetical protein